MKKDELFVSAFGGEEVFTGLVKDEVGGLASRCIDKTVPPVPRSWLKIGKHTMSCEEHLGGQGSSLNEGYDEIEGTALHASDTEINALDRYSTSSFNKKYGLLLHASDCGARGFPLSNSPLRCEV